MCLEHFGNKSKQANVWTLRKHYYPSKQKTEVCWQIFVPPFFKTNMFGSETDDIKGPCHSVLFLQQSDGLMFWILHLSQTPKARGPGALRFHPSQPTSILSLWRRYQWARQRRRGPLCPLQMFARVRLHFGYRIFIFLYKEGQPAWRRRFLTFSWLISCWV